MIRRVRGAVQATGDSGNALVEFLGAAVLLMIPAFYLVLTLARVQSAVLATEGAAQGAGRVLALAVDYADGLARAQSVVTVALEDQGFAGVDSADVLAVECTTAVGLAPGSEVVTSVHLDVGLPGLGGGGPLTVPVSATVVTPVDRFKEAP